MHLWPLAIAGGVLGETQPYVVWCGMTLGNPIRKSWRHHVQARKISPDAALRWVSDGGDKKFQRTSGIGFLDSGDFEGEILLMNGNVNSEISCPFSAFVRVSYFGHACWSPTEVYIMGCITFRILCSFLRIAGTAAVTVWEPYLHLLIPSFALTLLQVLRSICWFALINTLRFFAYVVKENWN